MIPACPAPRGRAGPRCRCLPEPATPMPMCSGRPRGFPMPPIAATPRRTRRSKNISPCSTPSALPAACWCRAARMAATIRRCSMRWRVSPTGCAALRSPTQTCRRRSFAAGMRSASAALRFNHFFRGGQLHYRGGVPLDAARVARARHEGARLAPAALDRRQGFAGHGSDPANRIGLPVVIDHMGRTDARAGIETPGFQSLLRFAR